MRDRSRTSPRTYSPLEALTDAGVRLFPCGSDRYRCACPVHGGDRPSMGVALYEGRWQITCFACGFNGGTPDLVMALRGCSLADAFRLLDGRGPDLAPVVLHRRHVIVLVCDAAGCGNTLDVTGQTYKVPGTSGPLWQTTPIEEAVFGHGWEIGANAEFALCPACLDGRKIQQERAPKSPVAGSGARPTQAGIPRGDPPM